MFRCQILINGISYEATDDLKNWDDFGISQKRSNYDGVIRSFSTKFEFVNRSYELLKEEFEQHYLSAKAAIVFYLRNNSWNWASLKIIGESKEGSSLLLNLYIGIVYA